MISEMIRCIYLDRKNQRNPNFNAKGFLHTTSRSFRVGLRDIDFNLHINNARYLIYMERARWDQSIQTNLWSALLKHKFNFVVASIEVGYIRELNLFKKFTVESTYLGWDEKYFYLEQRFVADGKLYTYGLVKVAFLQKGKLVEPQKTIETLGLKINKQPLPEHFELWKRLNTAKRAYAENPNPHS